MKVLNLACSHDHLFEGWFGSDADFTRQLDQGLVSCPMCGDAGITRMPTAPRIQITRQRDSVELPVPDSGPVPASEVSPQARWLKAVHHVLATTDDVGERFAEEARRIHYGEVQERAIRGRATPGEAEALRDEGIEVMSLPLPEALKGPLQ